MGFFSADLDEEDYDGRPNSSAGESLSLLWWVLKGALFVAFIPAVLIALVFQYLMFFKLRQRWTVSLFTGIAIAALSLAAGHYSGAFDQALTVFSSFWDLPANWKQAIPGVLYLQAALGSLIGTVVVMLRVGRLAHNPQDKKVAGSWTYGFEYNRSPLRYLRRKRKEKLLENESLDYSDRAPLGVQDDDKCDDVVSFYDSEARLHTLITGTTGSGKSETMKSLISSDIRAGRPVVMIDFKASKSLVSYLAYRAKEAGRPFYHFTSGKIKDYDIPNSLGPCSYDPLVNGGSARPDMLLQMREYDTAASVYKGTMRQLLQVLFRMIDEANQDECPNVDFEHGTLATVASVLADNFNEVVLACEDMPIYEDAQAVSIGVKSRTSHLARAMDELRGQVRTLFASDYGRWLRNSEGVRAINLYEATKPGSDAVVVFSITGDSEPDFASFFGSLVFSDLNALSSLRRSRGDKNMVKVYADEFQSVSPTSVTGLLEKARESFLGLTLSCQSMEQVVSSSSTNGEAYLLGIIDTISNFIIHAGASEDSATRMSKIVGQEMQTRYRLAHENSRHLLSLNWNNKRQGAVQSYSERDWVVPPEYFMRVKAPTKANRYYGQAVLLSKSCQEPKYAKHEGAVARKLKVVLPKIALHDYYANPVQTDATKESAPAERESALSEQELKSLQHSDYSYLLQDNNEMGDDAISSPDLPDPNDEAGDDDWGFETDGFQDGTPDGQDSSEQETYGQKTYGGEYNQTVAPPRRKQSKAAPATAKASKSEALDGLEMFSPDFVFTPAQPSQPKSTKRGRPPAHEVARRQQAAQGSAQQPVREPELAVESALDELPDLDDLF